jgi:hypothetical protein
MKTYIVTTQIVENYGAHDDTAAAPKHYWKPKGGLTYRVRMHDHSREWDAMGAVGELECSSSHYQIEYPVSAVSEEEWLESLEELAVDHRMFELAHVREVQIP